MMKDADVSLEFSESSFNDDRSLRARWQLWWYSFKFDKPNVLIPITMLRNCEFRSIAKKKLFESQQRKVWIRVVVSYIMILLCIMTWVLMAIELKLLEDTYHASYALVCTVHGSWAVALVVYHIWRFCMRRVETKTAASSQELSVESKLSGLIKFKNGASSEYLKATGSLGIDETRYIFLGFLTHIAGWFWYLSIVRTHLAANTCIYESSVAFVYLFSVIILKEKPKWYKTIAVIAAIIGVVAVTLGSEQTIVITPISTAVDQDVVDKRLQLAVQGEGGIGTQALTVLDDIWTTGIVQEVMVDGDGDRKLDSVDELSEVEQIAGYILVFLTMVFMALVQVLYKICSLPYKITKTEKGLEKVHVAHPHLNMEGIRALGWMGVASIFMSVFVPVMNATGVEEIQVPTNIELRLIIWICLLDIVFNACFLIAIGLVGPLTVSLGLLLTMPITMIIDRVNGVPMSAASIIGAALIFSAFLTHSLGGKLTRRGQVKNPYVEGLEDYDEIELNNIGILEDELLLELLSSREDSFTDGEDAVMLQQI